MDSNTLTGFVDSGDTTHTLDSVMKEILCQFALKDVNVYATGPVILPQTILISTGNDRDRIIRGFNIEIKTDEVYYTMPRITQALLTIESPVDSATIQLLVAPRNMKVITRRIGTNHQIYGTYVTIHYDRINFGAYYDLGVRNKRGYKCDPFPYNHSAKLKFQAQINNKFVHTETNICLVQYGTANLLNGKHFVSSSQKFLIRETIFKNMKSNLMIREGMGETTTVLPLKRSLEFASIKETEPQSQSKRLKVTQPTYHPRTVDLNVAKLFIGCISGEVDLNKGFQVISDCLKGESILSIMEIMIRKFKLQELQDVFGSKFLMENLMEICNNKFFIGITHSTEMMKMAKSMEELFPTAATIFYICLSEGKYRLHWALVDKEGVSIRQLIFSEEEKGIFSECRILNSDTTELSILNYSYKMALNEIYEKVIKPIKVD